MKRTPAAIKQASAALNETSADGFWLNYGRLYEIGRKKVEADASIYFYAAPDCVIFVPKKGFVSAAE